MNRNMGKTPRYWLFGILLSCLLFGPAPAFTETPSYSIERLVFTKTHVTGYPSRNFTVLEATTFNYPDDELVILYISLYNLEKKYEYKVDWYRPDGSLYRSDTHKTEQDRMIDHVPERRARAYYRNFIVKTEYIKNSPGKWKADVSIDGKLARTSYFTLTSNPSGQRAKPTQETPQSSASSAQGKFSLPQDIRIEPPESTVSAQIAAFSGAWVGAWDDCRPNLIIVEKVSAAGNASVIYCWGECPDLKDKRGFNRLQGKIENGRLALDRTNGTHYEYVYGSGGTLAGTVTNKNARVWKALLTATSLDKLGYFPPAKSSQEELNAKTDATDKEQARKLYDEGNSYFESKNYDLAIWKYEKAIVLEKQFAPLFYNLALAQIEIGQKKEAVANLKRYLELRSKAPNASEVKALIKSLGK